jgi:uncharacterized protein (UPF0262 family)
MAHAKQAGSQGSLVVSDNPSRLVRIELDEASLVTASEVIVHERRIAVHDLLENNSFEPLADDTPVAKGPYHLLLSVREKRLVFDIRQQNDELVGQLHLSMSPFRKIIKDYFMLCESYFEAIREAMPEQIETIDMARRAIHNEGSEILLERLKGKIEVDFDTARRLFTLICSFHLRNVS